MADDGNDESSRYPHLAPELRQLPEPSRRLWGDSAHRTSAIDAMLVAVERGDGGTAVVIARTLSDAVEKGLRALQLPSLGVSTITMREDFPAFRARLDNSELMLGVNELRRTLNAADGTDTIFRTLVHEYLHARQEQTLYAHTEARTHLGYEEGFSDGFADFIVRRKARMTPEDVSWPYYVAGYRSLAAAFSLDEETLWRHIWVVPPGDIRYGLVEVVAALQRATTGHTLDERRVLLLRANADRVFSLSRGRSRPNETELRNLWKLSVP